MRSHINEILVDFEILYTSTSRKKNILVLELLRVKIYKASLKERMSRVLWNLNI
jgi:hypothetical protein